MLSFVLIFLLICCSSNLGTLTPICKHPDLAVIPTETKKILERLANRRDVFVAIISGRSVANVKQMVGIEGRIIRYVIK